MNRGISFVSASISLLKDYSSKIIFWLPKSDTCLFVAKITMQKINKIVLNSRMWLCIPWSNIPVSCNRKCHFCSLTFIFFPFDLYYKSLPRQNGFWNFHLKNKKKEAQERLSWTQHWCRIDLPWLASDLWDVWVFVETQICQPDWKCILFFASEILGSLPRGLSCQGFFFSL